LTVHETLLLSAHFFLPDDVSLEQKERLIDSVIGELGLGKTRNTIIGDEKTRGVSGGERKRAAIAVQLIADPAVLFLDEPTSGLDSFQALAVMESMKNMADHGRLVISVIHQPRSSIFDMFDKLCLLSEGHAIYLGPAKEASMYFHSLGHHMHSFYNPADFFLDLLSPDTRTKENEEASHSRIATLSSQWITICADPEQPWYQHNKLLTASHTSNTQDSLIPMKRAMTYERFIRNFKLLFWRAFMEIIRDHTTIMIKLFVTVFFGCIIGAMYSQPTNEQAKIYKQAGLLFVISVNQAFNACIGVLTTFPKEKIVVNRERSSDAYDTYSYFVAKFIAELPVNVTPGFVFGIIIYWIVGLKANAFGYFLLILMMQVLTAISLGLAVSAISPNAGFATALGTPLVVIALIFGGFFSTYFLLFLPFFLYCV